MSKAKLSNNWRQLTLEDLENDYWGAAIDTTHLVIQCHELRKVPLDKFTTEDLRIMIGQEIGLPYLIPIALETLTTNLFAEGHFFEGDLLKNVLSINVEFWDNNKNHWTILNHLIKSRRDEIAAKKFDTTKFESSKHNF